MQQVHPATNEAATADESAALLLEVAPLVMRAIRTRMRANRAADVSVPQFRALGYLNRHPGASLTSLAEHLGLTLPATSRLVDGLARRAYLQRETSMTDRRSIELRIAPKGAEMLEMTRKGTLEHLTRLMSELTPNERASITRALDVLRGVFGSASDSAVADPADGVRATTSRKRVDGL